MQRTLIIYDSKYGCTHAVARDITLILGPARLCRVDHFDRAYRDYDLIVIGSPIYKGVMSPRIWSFVLENMQWLGDKKVAVFHTGLQREDAIRNLGQISGLLGGSVILTRALGGRLRLERLDEQDFRALESYSQRTGFPFQNADTLSREEVIDFGLAVKWARDRLSRDMPEDELLALVESFLFSHKTCTLATGYKDRVRATPLEYTYKDGHIYLISEGGEKYAHLLLSSRVSAAVYDEYRSMGDLAGLQMTGEAKVVDPGDEEYANILRIKGLKPEKVASLGIDLNIIKIKISKAELLYAKLKARGYSITQTYTF